MPGRIHEHDGMKVYHRRDGALVFHGRHHSRYLPGLDRKRPVNRWGKPTRAENRPPKKHYPHAGDGRPLHEGKDRPIHKKRKRTR